MDVLEGLESEPQESHSRGPGFESLCAHKNVGKTAYKTQTTPNKGVVLFKVSR